MVNTDYHPSFFFRGEGRLNGNTTADKISPRSDHAKMDNLRNEWQRVAAHTESKPLGNHHLNPAAPLIPISRDSLFQSLMRNQAGTILQAAGSDAATSKEKKIPAPTQRIAGQLRNHLKVIESNHTDPDAKGGGHERESASKEKLKDAEKKISLEKFLKRFQISHQSLENISFKFKMSTPSLEETNEVKTIFSAQISDKKSQ